VLHNKLGCDARKFAMDFCKGIDQLSLFF